MSLFKKAAKNSTKATKAKKDDKLSIKIKEDGFFDSVKEYQELLDTIKSSKAQSDFLYEDILNIGKEEWLRVYRETGKNPGSIILYQESEMGDETARVMYVPSDKYISIDTERSELLSEKWGEELIEETTEFSFDKKMVEKYGEVLSRLILDSDEIDEDDKEKIILATTKTSIKKGTINEASNFLKTIEEQDDIDIKDFIEDISPVMSLKAAEVLKIK